MLTNITRTHYNENDHDDYIFEIDGRKTVTIHVGKTRADMYVIGVSGKRLVHPCRTLGTFGDSFQYISQYPLDYDWVFGNIQKIISLPTISVNLKAKLIQSLCYNLYDRVEWKDLFAFIKDCNEDTVDGYINIAENIRRGKVMKSLEKYGLSDYRQYVDFYRLEYFDYKAFREGFKNAIRDHYAAPQAAVLAALGVERDELPNLGIRFDTYHPDAAVSKLYDDMSTLLSLIKTMELNDYKITNVARDCAELRAKWDREKTEWENKIFKRSQTLKDFNFETENYKIFLPTTRSELAKIGSYFHNCANEWEWRNRLSKGTHALVVVVDKTDNEQKVCVDIQLETMQIGQYLGKCNRSITTKELRDFKKLYQEYLDTLK